MNRFGQAGRRALQRHGTGNERARRRSQAWNALFVPKGTSAEIVAKLNASAVKALDDETGKKRLLELGSVIPVPADRTPQALGALVQGEIANWWPVLGPAQNQARPRKPENEGRNASSAPCRFRAARSFPCI